MISPVLKDAVWSPLDATGLSLDVRVMPGSKPNLLRLMVMFDPHTITIEERGGRYTAELDVLLVQQARDLRNVHGINDTVNLKLAEATYRKMMSQKAAAFHKEVELASEAHQIRVVVRDARSGQIGSLTIPLANASR